LPKVWCAARRDISFGSDFSPLGKGAMAFFRTINFSEPLPPIAGHGVTLRAAQMTDYGDWASLREGSRDFLTPWEPTWPVDDLTRSAFRRRIRRYAEDQRTDQAYAFLVIRDADSTLVGGLTLANIRRGVAQAGSLGYWMGLPYARGGHMTAAVRALIPFAFGSLRLHRLEAACIPANVASVRLLEKTGFVREGYAREYLCIDGKWQDHLLYARLKDDPAS
jgi:[ribosomal protein S5]-alanine N-acetyltransferase